MDDESSEILVPCEVCGEHATKYFTSYPVCNNIACFVYRLEYVEETITKMNNKIGGEE